MMHIFPGLNYFRRIKDGNEVDPIQEFWYQNYTQNYLQICKDFEDDILLNLGSHIHKVALKAPVSHLVPRLKLTVFASPSVSPIYLNNPGYSFIELEQRKAETDGGSSDIKLSAIKLRFF